MSRIWPWFWAIVVALVTLTLLVVIWYPHETGFNNYVLLAQSFAHGHVWVTPPGEYIDALAYRGRQYIIEGPLPAVLLIPAAAILGTEAKQTLLSFGLCSVAAGAGWELARRLGVPWRSRIVLTLFLLFGTDLFFCGIFGDVWFIAHVSAVCFTLLALVELTGRKRGWLVMVWAACAFESRFSMVLALPVYLYLLCAGATLREIRARVGSAAAVFIVVAALWIAYNRARWGVWYDIGYNAWYHQDPSGEPIGPPFKLKYLPRQLRAFFYSPPQLLPKWPYVSPTIMGLSLPFTSPGLLLAFFARRPARLVIALWVATLLTAAPNFLYYVTGFVQFGMRHALDFEPFLFALMCLAAQRGLRWWWVALCLYSSAVGIWGVWYWIVTVIRPNG